MHHTAPNLRPEGPQATPLYLLFVRITWIAIGPGILLLTLFKIVQNGTGWVTALDALFFVVLAITIASRWWDFNRGDRTTTTGEIATVTTCGDTPRSWLRWAWRPGLSLMRWATIYWAD